MGTDDRARCLGNMVVFEVWLRDCKVRMGADEHNHVHVERAREGGVDNGFRGVLVFVAGCVWGSALCLFFFIGFLLFFFLFFSPAVSIECIYTFALKDLGVSSVGLAEDAVIPAGQWDSACNENHA